MSNPINLSSASLSSSALEIAQRNPEEQTVEQASIDILPDEVLGIIFTYIAENGRQTEAVLNLKKVCRRWDKVVDIELLSRCWTRLSDRITSHTLTTCANSINLYRLTIATLNKLYPSNHIPEQPYFPFFRNLTRNLIQRGVHVPHLSPVLGFTADAYEQAQADLDLEKIWIQRIQPQIEFRNAPIPSNAAAIRAWLQDPANAPKIAIGRLDLSNMDLQVLPSEIGNLNQLHELHLNHNNLTTLPPVIGNLNQLQCLYLNYNKLTTLPPEIGNLNQLRYLELNCNKLTTLPHEIGNLNQLQSLSLYINNLTTLPSEIGNLNQLKSLSLNGNNLTTLPHEIGNLNQLEWLQLERNNLTTLPPEIGNLNQLQYLYLNYNQLTTLPAWIGNLNQLLYLYLNRNNLTTLPSEIGNLNQLETLYLDNNDLTTLPPEIGKLYKLHVLNLSYNNFTTIPPEIENLNRRKRLTVYSIYSKPDKDIKNVDSQGPNKKRPRIS